MSISDPIADALTMIRNAVKADKEKVDLRASKLIAEILRLLKKDHFIHDFKFMEDEKQGILRVYLKNPKKDSLPQRRIVQLQRVSKPGLRIYVRKDSITKVLGGLGRSILSTPKGILTGEEAKDQGVGGELLLKVW